MWGSTWKRLSRTKTRWKQFDPQISKLSKGIVYSVWPSPKTCFWESDSVLPRLSMTWLQQTRIQRWTSHFSVWLQTNHSTNSGFLYQPSILAQHQRMDVGVLKWFVQQCSNNFKTCLVIPFILKLAYVSMFWPIFRWSLQTSLQIASSRCTWGNFSATATSRTSGTWRWSFLWGTAVVRSYRLALAWRMGSASWFWWYQ